MRCLLALVVAAVAAAAPESVERTLTPGIATIENLDDSNGLLRVPGAVRQEAGQPIAIEAESAGVLRFTANKAEVSRDAAAGGGVAVAHIQHAEYPFTVVTPGKYTAWYRAWYPWAGTWHHAENMDGGELNGVPDSQGEVLKEWVWHNGPTYDLAGGRHSWNLTPYGFMGGARLDRLVLVPAGGAAPTGLGPAASPTAVPPVGVAITHAVAGRRVLGWDRLEIGNLSGTGSYTAAWSADGGATWQDIPADGSLAAAPAGRDIAFRLTLRADAEGRSPVLSMPLVHFRIPAVDELVLANDRVRWRFAGEDGAIVGLTNMQTGADYIVPDVRSPLFSFRAIRGEVGNPQDLWFSQAQLVDVDSGADRVVFHHSFIGGQLTTALTVELIDNGQTRFSLRVDNRSEWNVCEVNLPVLYGLRIGADEKDDFLMQPACTGEIVQYPAQFKVPRLVYSDRPLVWPGQGFVCFTELWDTAGGGLYLASYEKQPHHTEFRFSPGYPTGTPGGNAFGGTVVVGANTGDQYKRVDPPAPWIHLGFMKQQLIDPTTGPVTVADVIVGVHQGDWHWGADRYREWAASWMPREKRLPAWARDVPGYVDSHMTHLGAFVDMAKGNARAWTPRVPMAKPPFPFIAMWAQQTSCEAYWATPVLHYVQGSAEEFAGNVAKLHETGSRFAPYALPPRINPIFHHGAKRNGSVPLSMIPADEIPPAGFYRDVGMRDYRGELVEPADTYREGLVDFCNPHWQEYLMHIVLDKYIRQYGCDGMYLDGMGLCGYPRGMRTHGHGYGEWHQSWLAWMKRLRDEARKIRPNAVFVGEGMCDVDHQYLDMGLFYMGNSPEVYRYTIPWTVGVLHYNGGLLYPLVKKDEDLEVAILLGIRLGMTSDTAERRPDYFATGMAFWNRFNQWQFRARFDDDLGVTAPETLVGKLWRREDEANRGALWVGFNRGDAPAELRVARSRVGNARIAWLWTWEGERRRLEPRVDGDDYVVAVPAAHMAAVLLAERCEPLVDVLARPRPICPGESGGVQVRVRHLGPDRAAGQVKLRLPDGWGDDMAAWNLGPGDSAEYDLGITVGRKAAFDVHDFTVVATTGGVTAERADLIGVCRPIDAEITWLGPSSLRVDLVNRGDRTVKGTCTLDLPKPVRATRNKIRVTVPPRGNVSLVFDLENTAAIVTREHVQARVRYDGIESVGYELVQPAMLNGDFEQCIAGDGVPDYWNYRMPQGLYYQGRAMDAEIKRSGKYSLRLDPNPKERTNCLQQSFVQLVPGRKYRLTGWVRRSAAVKGVGIQVLVFGGGANVFAEPPADTPADQWCRVETELTAPPRKNTTIVACHNATTGAATAWFDDITLEVVD